MTTFMTAVQMVETLRTENKKLRDENGALIRVISKLSKWTAAAVDWSCFLRVFSVALLTVASYLLFGLWLSILWLSGLWFNILDY